jgi:glycosyltransferase involved in cell wall biosynthesis
VVPFYVWLLMRQRYDFVWINFAGYGEAEALSLMRLQSFGIIFHFPYDQVPHRYEEFRRFDIAARATAIVSVSQFVADGVQRAFGHQSTVIHHGVDTARFCPDPAARTSLRRHLGFSDTQPLLVTAAALEERKGVQWVLHALPAVLHEFPDLVYFVVGDGPYRAELERLALALGVENRVCFVGAQANIAPYLQAADLSLILSRGEASSLAALEALACGLPLIAADCRPFDELVRPEYGSLVIPDDAAMVANTILHILRSPDVCRTMKLQGRERVLADFTWHRVAAEYLRLLTGD